MTIDRMQIGDQVVLHVAGRMDADNSSQFEEQCQACLAEGVRNLVVDLGELRYVSSLGLRSFVSIGQKLKERDGELRICRMTGLVRQVFEITRLNLLFPLFDTVESALMKS